MQPKCHRVDRDLLNFEQGSQRAEHVDHFQQQRHLCTSCIAANCFRDHGSIFLEKTVALFVQLIRFYRIWLFGRDKNGDRCYGWRITDQFEIEVSLTKLFIKLKIEERIGLKSILRELSKLKKLG